MILEIRIILFIEGCSANQFTCNNGHCVPSTARCNGNNECKDGSDESNCGNLEIDNVDCCCGVISQRLLYSIWYYFKFILQKDALQLN